MWELDCEESWVPKNWCFWTVALEKTLESPLDRKEIQPVHPKGAQSWVFIGRTDVEAEIPILRPPHVKSWLIRKDPDAGKDWGQEEKGTDDRGWDGWMASPAWWTRVWVDSRCWWWTGRPGVLWFMGLQRVGHDWATELNRRMQVDDYVPNTDTGEELSASADLSEFVTWLRGVSLPGRLTHLAVGWRPRFLTTATFPQGSFSALTMWRLTFLRWDSRQREEEGIWTWRSHAAISPSSSGFHSPLSPQCDARGWHSLESSWRLATRVPF